MRLLSSCVACCCCLIAVVVVLLSVSTSGVSAQNATTTTTATAPASPPAGNATTAASPPTTGAATPPPAPGATPATPAVSSPSTTAAPTPIPIEFTLPSSRIDLIFSFFAEDRDSINSYAVTIAQLLFVPLRRVDFYNVRPGDTIPEDARRPSNTPFGAKTMVRVTIQPPLPTEADQSTAVEVRDKLLAAVKDKNIALIGIFVDDANPIDTNDIYAYNVRTAFDLMYTFVMGTMGIAYVIFITFVIYKIVKAHQYANLERLNRQKEKERRKVMAKSMARRGKKADEDDEEEVVDASKWDDIGDDNGDDDGQGETVKDEDCMAVRTLANDVANMLRSEQGGGPQVSFGSGRRTAAASSSKLLSELDHLALPPTRKGNNDEDDL